MPIQISPQGLQLQQQAMGMPRDQMQALLNQQIGLIPLPELLAIKSAVDRAQLRSAPPQAQPEQTTVAQDLMIQKGTQDRMQGGVATLPVANVGNEAAYAGGGIVAFQNRGLVEGTSPFKRRVIRPLLHQAERVQESFYVQPEDEARMQRNRAKQELMAEIRNMYGPKAGAVGYFMEQSDEERQQAQDLIKRLPDMSVEEMQAILGVDSSAAAEPTTPEPAPSAIPEQGAPQSGAPGRVAEEDVLGQYGLGAVRKRQFGPFEKAPPQIRQFGGVEDMPEEETERGALAPPPAPEPEQPRMTAPTEADFGITPELRARVGKDEKARVEEIQKFRGEDVLAKQEGELKGERERRTGKAANTRDMWLALSQGFFEMAASGKPTFSGALAAGAQRGFDAYRQAIDKRDTLKEKYDDKLAEIARAKQAQAEGDYRYAASQLREDQKELSAAQRALKTAQLRVQEFEVGHEKEARLLQKRIDAENEQRMLDRKSKEMIAGQRAATQEANRLRVADNKLFDDAKKVVVERLGYELGNAFTEGDPDAVEIVSQRILDMARMLQSGRSQFGQTPSGGAAPAPSMMSQQMSYKLIK